VSDQSSVGAFRTASRLLQPRLFLKWLQNRSKIREYDNADPDIIISGFPRSANTFLTLAVKHRLEQAGVNRKVFSHDHSVNIIKYACKRSIPCVVPIRTPLDAILSTYIYFDKEMEVSELVQWYLAFYQYVSAHHEHFIVVRYEDVIGDINGVMTRIGNRIGINFPAVENLQEERDSLFRIMKDHSREIRRSEAEDIRQVGYPVTARSKLKELHESAVMKEIAQDEALGRLYESIVGKIRWIASEDAASGIAGGARPVNE
jgi:hypothetical protein